MQKITTFLTFANQAEDALSFYASVFLNSKIGDVRRYGNTGPGAAGSFMTGTLDVEGQKLMLLNAGADFGFSPGMSLFVDCKTQQEVDELWDKLSVGGEKKQCGWLQDKFGVSWQIVPSALGEMLRDKDPVKAQRVMRAMMQMHKIDIEHLKQAYAES